mgnify:CR=1 FL=1
MISRFALIGCTRWRIYGNWRRSVMHLRRAAQRILPMLRIALVDGDRNILTALSTMLEAEGFEIEIYYDGQAAWEAFTKNMPDLAVLEIKIPNLDGMDLLQRMRQKTAIPIIFLTTKTDEIDEVLGL